LVCGIIANLCVYLLDKERFEGSDELREKYVRNSITNKLLNDIKYGEYQSAYKNMPRSYRSSRMAWRVYNSRVPYTARTTYAPYMKTGYRSYK